METPLNKQEGSSIAIKIIALTLLMLSTYTMASIALPYLLPPFPTDIDFLRSKQKEVQIPYWMGAFYVHISTSVLVLATGIFQFSKTLMYKDPIVHRNLGKIYVFLILFVAAPSGLIMAFHGNGGWPARYAFILQAVGWWFLTYMAYSTIRKKQLQKHAEYMIRSYALSLSAISLRGMSYIMHSYPEHLMLGFPEDYILIAWLSWALNLVIAELLIWGGFANYYFKKTENKLKNKI